jgi:hypothetical protein
VAQIVSCEQDILVVRMTTKMANTGVGSTFSYRASQVSDPIGAHSLQWGFEPDHGHVRQPLLHTRSARSSGCSHGSIVSPNRETIRADQGNTAARTRNR